MSFVALSLTIAAAGAGTAPEITAKNWCKLTMQALRANDRTAARNRDAVDISLCTLEYLTQYSALT